MKRFSEQFKKQAESIKMTATAKKELRARVVSYMEYHPLPKEMAQKVPVPRVVTKGAIASEAYFAFTFNKIYTRSFAGLFATLVILGVPAIAERALPGDVLYPVKVQFNEELRSSLSFSPYAKVEWETERLSRRIAEARLLASEGKLTEEAEADFAEAVKTHTDAAQREIAELRITDSDAAAIAEIAFASALSVESQVLVGHIENDTTNEEGEDGHSVLALAQVVAKAESSALAAQTNSLPSYDKLLAVVEQESTNMYELFSSVKKDAKAEEIVDVERRIADVERKISEAIARKEGTVIENKTEIATLALSHAKQAPVSDEVVSDTMSLSMAMVAEDASSTVSVTEENEGSEFAVVSENQPVEAVESIESTEPSEEEAVALLRLVLTDIQKLLNYLTNIDVRESVSIEDLVPVTPTTQERAVEVMRFFDEAIDLQAQIEAREIPPRLRSKVNYGINDLERQYKRITSLMQKGHVDEAYVVANDVRNIASDLERLTSNDPVKDPTTAVVPQAEVQGTSTEAVAETATIE